MLFIKIQDKIFNIHEEVSYGQFSIVLKNKDDYDFLSNLHINVINEEDFFDINYYGIVYEGHHIYDNYGTLAGCYIEAITNYNYIEGYDKDLAYIFYDFNHQASYNETLKDYFNEKEINYIKSEKIINKFNL